MIKQAVRMKLYPGQEAEYEKRHKELWPEMREMLKKHGAQSYSIFLDRETNYLFGYLEIEDEEKWQAVPKTAINQKWWEHMKDIMETNPDNSPISEDLVHVFEL
ncbi:L-rhamnose mutarotase [Enterococcus devriesei]|uniref:L-rhamnose mutarotase n=1 Tax=Enterococcus devriesei TaxID=319970 RepID=A0A1L8STG2_9ENTE|nr:L-rhamnose mutarotase [Enterococcus devriesei]OJG35266.1 L-rhamnose 1-epimerase [Enterococcus devriesei]